ncbi:MAG TPA: CARDB domain-containing protein [Pyrinomonadaceae bacterium]|nr:CARDB domain-containing protein [Pyrinomonadaceae bacterium]
MTRQIALTLLFVLFAFLSTCRSQQQQQLANLACQPDVASPTNFFVQGLGINGFVMEDPGGAALSGLTNFSITNNGAGAVQTPYNVQIVIQRTTLIAAGGATTVSPGATLATCTVTGPALQPGGSASITFPPSSCTGVLPSPLLCGLYLVTLNIDSDNQITESDEQDNSCRRYYHVPSAIKGINFDITPDPNDPNGADNVMEVVGAKDVLVTAPGAPVRPYIETAFKIKIMPNPASESFNVIGLIRTDGGPAGDSANFTVQAPAGFPLPVGNNILDIGPVNNPVELSYIVNVPNTNYANSPCTDIGPPSSFTQKLDTTLTAISQEGPGCILRQQTLKLSVRYECR